MDKKLSLGDYPLLDGFFSIISQQEDLNDAMRFALSLLGEKQAKQLLEDMNQILKDFTEEAIYHYFHREAVFAPRYLDLTAKEDLEDYRNTVSSMISELF